MPTGGPRGASNVRHQPGSAPCYCVLASFWMDWPRNAAHSSNDDPFTVGIDGDVGTGYAVLVLGVMTFSCCSGTCRPPRSSAGAGAGAIAYVHVAGIAVAVMAAASIIGSVMYAEIVGSGPVLALIGSLMVTRSVVPATEPAGETAEPGVATPLMLSPRLPVSRPSVGRHWKEAV